MAYNKHNFKSGEILTARELNEMEDGIVNNIPVINADDPTNKNAKTFTVGTEVYSIPEMQFSSNVDKTATPLKTITKNGQKWNLADDSIINVEGLPGVTIPVIPSMFVKNIYFNTSLDINSVKTILSKITFIEKKDIEYIFLDSSDEITATIKLGVYRWQTTPDSYEYIISDLATEMVLFSTTDQQADIGASFIGWNPSFNGTLSINKSGVSFYDNYPVGANNNLLSEFISLSAFNITVDNPDSTYFYRVPSGDLFHYYNNIWQNVGNSPIIANPVLNGTEPELTGISIDNFSYKVAPGLKGVFQAVDHLPLITEEEYNKKILYLKGNSLYYISKVFSSDFHISKTYKVYEGTEFKIYEFDSITGIIGKYYYKLCHSSGIHDSKSCEKIDLDTFTSTKLKDYSGSYSRHTPIATATYNNELYIIGGHNSASYGQSIHYYYNVEKYNPETDSYIEYSKMPKQLKSGASVVIGNDIYIFGAYINGETGQSNIVFKYNIPNNTWEEYDTLLNDRKDVYEACYYNDNEILYTLRGSTSQKTNDKLYIYNITNKQSVEWGEIPFIQGTIYSIDGAVIIFEWGKGRAFYLDLVSKKLTEINNIPFNLENPRQISIYNNNFIIFLGSGTLVDDRSTQIVEVPFTLGYDYLAIQNQENSLDFTKNNKESDIGTLKDPQGLAIYPKTKVSGFLNDDGTQYIAPIAYKEYNIPSDMTRVFMDKSGILYSRSYDHVSANTQYPSSDATPLKNIHINGHTFLNKPELDDPTPAIRGGITAQKVGELDTTEIKLGKDSRLYGKTFTQLVDQLPNHKTNEGAGCIYLTSSGELYVACQLEPGLPAPTSCTFNESNSLLTWSSVSSATSYIVEFDRKEIAEIEPTTALQLDFKPLWPQISYGNHSARVYAITELSEMTNFAEVKIEKKPFDVSPTSFSGYDITEYHYVTTAYVSGGTGNYSYTDNLTDGGNVSHSISLVDGELTLTVDSGGSNCDGTIDVTDGETTISIEVYLQFD